MLTVSTDPAYPPQSELNKDTGEYEGFDIDVATEIAKRLGVDIAWEAPAWETITSGNWNGRWDISVGSMTITPERAEVLRLHAALLLHAGAIAVHKDNTTITDVERARTARRSAPAAAARTTSTSRTSSTSPRTSPAEPVKIESEVTDPEIKTYDTDSTAIQDLALGDGRQARRGRSPRMPTLQAAIKAGSPIKIVGDPSLLRAALGGDRQELDSSIRRVSSNGSPRSSTRCTRTGR